MRPLRPEVEAAPLGDLRAIEEAALREGLVARAARSALYRDRWAAAGVDPPAVRAYEDLQRLPYVRGADLREAWLREPDAMLADPEVRLWFATSGTTGAPKWTPYGRWELAMLEEVVLRDFQMIVTRETPHRWAIFATPAPFISEAAAYALLFSQVAAGRSVEYLFTSPTQAEAALTFLAQRRPTAVLGFPSLLLRIAEGVEAEAPAAARAAWRAAPSPRTAVGVLAATVMRIRPRHIYRPEIGLFGGGTAGTLPRGAAERLGAARL